MTKTTKKQTDEVEFDVMVADESHEKYVDIILDTIEIAARKRGSGIARRTHEYVAQKMREGKVIIATDKFRNHGLAKRIKHAAFQLARLRWPKAKLFSLTSGSAVMKMNTELGYVPVTFSDLTDDEAFWRGCNGCVNHDVLTRTQRQYCICTAMLFDPEDPRCLMLEKLNKTWVKRRNSPRSKPKETKL